MKKDYEAPQIELLRLKAMGILTESAGDGGIGEDLEGDGNEWPWDETDPTGV